MGRMPTKTAIVLKNVHETYKLIYIIIMSFPLIISLDKFFLLVNSGTGIENLKDFQQIQLSDALLFIVFIMLFFRFFLGDLRFLDSKYIELQYENFNPNRHTPKNRIVDFISLLIHAVFFYLLSTTLFNFPIFYKICIGVLFFNAFWLIICFYLIPKNDRKIKVIKNSMVWAINNIVFGFFLVIFLIFSENLTLKYSIYVFFILAFLNSLVDFILTWDTYFPIMECEDDQ